jgi:hypothetical protein
MDGLCLALHHILERPSGGMLAVYPLIRLSAEAPCHPHMIGVITPLREPFVCLLLATGHRG